MGKNSKDIVITTALRTAIGKYNGSLKEFQAHDLGKAVIKKILNKSKSYQSHFQGLRLFTSLNIME